ncbi:MAG: pullulanase-type alpha-1,6-glucosidase [Anaerolineae bacterium]|nr:pullulanase-type alpha-1,6-glucosidase [Anaerolineae bacterium]
MMKRERWLDSVLVFVLLAGLLSAALGATKPVLMANHVPNSQIQWSGTGHFVLEAVGYIPSPYTVSPNFRQASTSTAAANSTISNADSADLFVNFSFDTTGTTVYLVYTTDGTAPNKTNGTPSTASFSNYSEPNRTWRVNLPMMSTSTVVNYVFYISNGSLADAWGRISGNPSSRDTSQYQTSWSEVDDAYFTYTVIDGTPTPITVTATKTLWLDVDTIAWNGVAGSSYKLLYDPNGGLTSAAESTACSFPTPAAPCYVSLTANGTVSGYPKNPNATGLTRLLTGLSVDNAKHLLQGQVVVASYNSSGTRVDATRAQIQSVLDYLYVDNGTAETAILGVTYSGDVPTLKVWAPTAKSVSIRKYEDSSTATYTSHALSLDAASGVWSVTGIADWDRDFYLLDVEVYVPSADAVVHNLVSDPYAVALSQDGTATEDVRSQFVNLADSDLEPTGWDTLSKPALANFEDISIYEMHIRDFSINDSTVSAGDRGTYMAYTYDGKDDTDDHILSDGMAHLLALEAAGLTHVHLLPTFDIASVREDVITQTVWPAPTGYDRNSEDQQNIVGQKRVFDSFNWGYDPHHYGVPEGSYATDPNGVTRILEFREMVSALNQNGLRVVMDVVYNHTAASGQDDKSVLDKVVPGYYYRYDTNGVMYNTSCCSDTAMEYAMMEKLMVDTVIRFAVDYKVDGFRFDLMNLHTRQNMEHLQAAVQALTPASNGVEGDEIYLYGEGWDFGSAKEKGLTDCTGGWCYAQKYNMTGSGIGCFNDIIRDAAHGGYSQDDIGIRQQGFLNGLSYDWNGYEYANRYQSDLWIATDKLRSSLRGSGTDWNGQGAPFTDDPQESVPYVEKHDNETLFDQNVFKLPVSTGISDRVRAQNMGQSLVGLAQGVPFFQMGTDMLRSKSLDRNSYDSGDWFNRVDWTYATNYFGSGLPPAWDNESRWDIMSPLLLNTALDPATTDIAFAAAHFREVLRLRYSSPLFRLTTEADINARVTHYNTGNTQDALIVMRLSDETGTDLDSNWENILVFFNANTMAQSITISGANDFTLHPIQADATDADAVVQTSAFNDTTDTFSIPARTTAVFVSTQSLTPPTPPSTIDWVGKMYPRGGVANAINQGAFVPTGFDIFVRVYDAGVTEAAGAPTGIACTLHWGKYGESFSDLVMTWNVQIGNDDEFKATIPQSTLNALDAGTYGFTAYCQKTGEDKKWKVDQYNIDSASDDDQGDGLITVIPSGDPRPAPEGGVFVHLFEWRWADIQKECAYLAEKGYSAVQVSPPQEHLVPTADQGGSTANDFPWWVRYQPVTHSTSAFTSRSGTWAEFQSMVSACNDLGVDIYVDAVINHMADIEVPVGVGTGTAGTSYDSTVATRYYGTQYQADDFHTDCTISDYSDRYQVQRCKLSGLPDLDTGKTDVQAQIRAYLQALINAGVKGFRVDGAKHMAAHDIAAIFDGLTGDFYVFQEMIDASGERVRDWEYTPNGDVTEFAYPYALGAAFDDACTGSLSDLEGRFDDGDMLASRFAQVFTDNHDNQRGHGLAPGQCIVDHRDEQEHVLANIFALAYPYGYPALTSSYYWQSDSTNNAGDSMGPPSSNDGGTTWGVGLGAEARPVYGTGQVAGDIPANCSANYENGKWVCEHRRTATANMVRFRWVTAGEAVTWQNIGATPTNHIALGLGAKGFAAINRTENDATTTYTTSMPDGDYCDIVKYDFLPTTGQCVEAGTTTPTTDKITISGGQIAGKTLASMDAFAIHIGARMETNYNSLPNSYGLTWHIKNAVNPVRLGNAWNVSDGVSFGTFQAGGTMAVTVNVQNASADRWLRLWFDWNKNGVFDSNERVINQAVSLGNNALTVSVPATISTAIPYRARLYDASSMTGMGILAADPGASDGATGGEVEDGSSPVPTAVFLTSFAAAPQGESILLTWETAAELQNLGFNLYRAEAFAGPWTRLNAELIPAQNPGATFGASYEWLDTGVTPDTTYFYRLEDLDVNGASTFHGPVSATATGVTAVALASFGAQGSAPAVLLLALAAAFWHARRRESADS